MTINEYLEKTANVTIIKQPGIFIVIQKVRPHITCADGFTVSIQASETHYCEPRITQYYDGKHWQKEILDRWGMRGSGEFESEDSFTPYESVEIGYPSVVEPDILDYAEDGDDPTNTVYACVPVEIVDKVLEKHGGIEGWGNRFMGVC